MAYWLSALIALTLSYALYIPLPAENTVDLIKVHVMEIGMRLAYYYPMNALKFAGVDWQVWWARKSLGALIRLLRFRTLVNPGDTVQVSNSTFDGVPVIVYDPQQRRTEGAIVFIHGGGFVLLDADAYDQFSRHLAAAVGAPVFSIDYRTAPEHKFPTPLDDCDKAITHLLDIAHRQYSIDPHRVAIIGDSAGGNLAAGSALRLITRTGKPAKPKLQVLLYPLLQFIDFQTPSYSEAALYGGSALADPESIARLFSLYIGLTGAEAGVLMKNGHIRKEAIANHVPFLLDDIGYGDLPFNLTRIHHGQCGEAGKFNCSQVCRWKPGAATKLQAQFERHVFNPEVSPLMREDLSPSPKTLLITCQYDPLRDEGYWYAKRLQKAGVDITWRHYENAFHGIINLHAELRLAERMLNDVVNFLSENL